MFHVLDVLVFDFGVSILKRTFSFVDTTDIDEYKFRLFRVRDTGLKASSEFVHEWL